MGKEKRKAGPQPDGSCVLTGDEEQAYKVTEKPKEEPESDENRICFGAEQPYKMPERQIDGPDEKEDNDVEKTE